MVVNGKLSKRIISYLVLAVVAVLSLLQLYATHLKNNPSTVAVRSPAQDATTPSPTPVSGPVSPFTDIQSYCNSLPSPHHPRGLFVSDRTPKDGPIKIFFWKQISWSEYDRVNWDKEAEKMCLISPELQPFFDYFAKTITRNPNRHWTPGYAPCYFWTTFHTYMMSDWTSTCQTTTNGNLDYVYTTNYTEFASSDVILFNYAYLFAKSSTPFFESQLMPPRLAHQKWILHFYDESVAYYPHVALPRFLQEFDLTVGSPPSLMDIPHPTNPITQERALELANVEPTQPFDKIPEHYIAFMTSNCEAKNDRNTLMDKLIENAGAHSYGTCYITEKIYDVFASGSIPVYMGAADIADFVPEGSYINVNDFDTYDDLIDYMKTVDREPFYRWKKTVKIDPSKFCKSCFPMTKSIPCAIVDSINFV
ncbi:4-alpha-L-fucosyltransferase [Mortierella sp. GBA39]|nr:4-alpha-L-fucosyltransferase [Mortierella sp. GBA39]